MSTSFNCTTDNRRPITFIRKLDTVGDGSGTTNMAVDGDPTPVIFKIKPAAGQIFQVSRLIIYISDNSSFDSGGWGALGGSPLTNGCIIKKIQNGVTYEVEPLTSNGQLAALMYDTSHESYGSGAEFLVGRLTFTKFGGEIRLKGDNGDELQFVIQDDIDALVEQYVHAEGWIEDTLY